MLFILKKNRKLRLYINYKYLNKAIIKNYYLILLILELIDKLRRAKYFNNLSNKRQQPTTQRTEGHEWLIAFKISYRLYKYIVMFIELTNALVTFQAIINYILREYLDVFILVYLDNVLVYTNRILNKYIKYTKKVLQKLKEHNLYI
ncbi:DNA/RNA polymerase, partial [Zopfia rhizophila CBS 207.26]